MFDKNRVHFKNAYYKETEKPFGYLVVANKPDTPADKQVLGDLFDDCHVYLFATQTKKRTILMSSPHRVTSLEENNTNIIGILPGRMQLFPSGKTTVWERR
jgi:hypothetical protein